MQNPICFMHNVFFIQYWVLFQETQWNLKISFAVSINLLILHLAFRILLLEVVGQNGLEPSTSRLSVVCSSQLSYWPIFRRNQIHNFCFEISISKLYCVFVSPLRTKPASLGFVSVPFGFSLLLLGTYLLYPLNWITLLFELFHTLVLTYRTLQDKSSLTLKSP